MADVQRCKFNVFVVGKVELFAVTPFINNKHFSLESLSIGYE